MAEYLKNYEHFKLEIIQPDFTNYLVILFFVVLIILTIKKDKSYATESRLLSILHTDQLRGVAIFFVVLGHLWVHVSKTKPQIILSGDSVALFLMLSGFGLAISTRNQVISFKYFCLKRIKRVMIPYWLVTMFIIILDYLFLDRTLKVDSLLMTILGINTRVELRHIDYVRWFVTFVLLWYMLFYIFFIKYRSKYSSALLLIIAFFMLPLNYYFFHFGWYQFFSFPVGCLLAIHYERLIRVYKNNKPSLIILSFLGIFYVLFYKILMSYEIINSMVTELIPNVLLAYFSEWNSLILSLSSLILIGQFIEMGFNSKFLFFLGKYSYEIFLLHGVFLIKYNPVIRSKNTFEISFQFYFLFIFVATISILIYKIHHSFYDKKTT